MPHPKKDILRRHGRGDGNALHRRLKRLTDRLAKVEGTHLDAVIAKAEEMRRELAAKREQLKELQRAGCRPTVKRVRE